MANCKKCKIGKLYCSAREDDPSRHPEASGGPAPARGHFAAFGLRIEDLKSLKAQPKQAPQQIFCVRKGGNSSDSTARIKNAGRRRAGPRCGCTRLCSGASLAAAARRPPECRYRGPGDDRRRGRSGEEKQPEGRAGASRRRKPSSRTFVEAHGPRARRRGRARARAVAAAPARGEGRLAPTPSTRLRASRRETP